MRDSERVELMRETELRRNGDYWRGAFTAMGSPCEVLIEIDSETTAQELLSTVAIETWRIEDKFSRYLPDNIVDQINSSGGETISVDDETANLLDFASALNELSNARFDITSGVLREAWVFDGGNRIPGKEQIAPILESVGWSKVRWQRPQLTLQKGMQIDFGGIGKEYAVDTAAEMLRIATDSSCLINFGGDLVVTTPLENSTGWQVGIEALGNDVDKTEHLIRLQQGALATSGDARRFLLKDGVRYGHILDPTTGWPVTDAPRSITVAADTCTQAGMLATLAMLKGPDAEQFLEQQQVQFWCLR
ncbi:MAG: FAD:protein FMN transferase [Woeseiaceae bacterium]